MTTTGNDDLDPTELLTDVILQLNEKLGRVMDALEDHSSAIAVTGRTLSGLQERLGNVETSLDTNSRTLSNMQEDLELLSRALDRNTESNYD